MKIIMEKIRDIVRSSTKQYLTISTITDHNKIALESLGYRVARVPKPFNSTDQREQPYVEIKW